MFKLYFIGPDNKVAVTPCHSLEEAREGKKYLPAGSFFCIESRNGEIIDYALEYEGAINTIQLLKLIHISSIQPK